MRDATATRQSEERADRERSNTGHERSPAQQKVPTPSIPSNQAALQPNAVIAAGQPRSEQRSRSMDGQHWMSSRPHVRTARAQLLLCHVVSTYRWTIPPSRSASARSCRSVEAIDAGGDRLPDRRAHARADAPSQQDPRINDRLNSSELARIEGRPERDTGVSQKVEFCPARSSRRPPNVPLSSCGRIRKPRGSS